MKYSPYSVSKIECYNQCPRKFYNQYILKPKVKQSWFHLEKGKLWHKLIELKIQNKISEFKKPNFQELTQKDYIEQLKNIKEFFKTDLFQKYYNQVWYEQYFEQYFCVDKDLNPCKKKDGLILGYIDLLQICDNTIEVIDYKTGKYNNKFPKSNFQLDIYACVSRKKYNIDKITGKYFYVEHDIEVVKNEFDYDKIWRDLIFTVDKIEQDTKFERKDQILCNWCPFYDLCH